jgi:hypothetical protein
MKDQGLRKLFTLLLALGLMAAFTGCASLITFNTPKEFKDGKFKEDPPL